MKNSVISREYVEKNYIHKDKIREKMKLYENEINRRLEEQKEENDLLSYDPLIPVFMTSYDVLKELLEETEDENNNTNNDSFKKE